MAAKEKTALTERAPISENAHRGYQLLPASLPRTRTLLTTRRRWRNRVSVRRRASGRVHYNYFRDYDPAIGGYIQADPSGLNGGWNAYGYAMANPLAFFDRFGLKPGDMFKDLDSALRDLMKYAPTIKPTFLEHGGWIYTVDKCFTYNAPLTGKPGGFIPGEDFKRTRPPTAVASWHTHGFRTPTNPGDNSLSGGPGDPHGPGDRDAANADGLPIYLIPPRGGAVGYDPSTKQDINVKPGEPEPCPCQSKQ
jgi:RHS repeat-associated protein